MPNPEFDQSYPSDFSQEVRGESLTSVEAVPEHLGFIETPELKSLKMQWIEAEDAETYQDAVTRYHERAQELVDQHNDASRPKAQIGLIVQMALIRRDMGKLDIYIEDIEAALVYAQQVELEEVVSVLEQELTPTSERLAYACREVLSNEDTEELATMPLGEALGYAFTLLIENGIEDPEDFLRQKGILE